MATDPAPWCGQPLPDDRDGWRTRALAFKEAAEEAEAEVERLRTVIRRWEEFDFERDNPKRLVEHILALMVERDNAQATAGSLSEEMHRLAKDNERLTAHLREIETMAARHEESAEWKASAAIPGILGRARRALRGEQD